MMASFITLTVLFGFTTVLCCLQLLGGDPDTMATTVQTSSQSGDLAPRLAAAALVPAVMATLTLTPLLTFAHVRELVRAKAAGNDGGAGAGAGAVSRLVVVGLARATLLAATAALLAACAVVQLGADGHLDRGRVDVARLNIK